ncbi:uncharacterized protein HMPREF1541_10604 [Cyphellophora europaea CBS 101466]|uniref:Heterokaryon incompatibility domain-containing protein n=1 Tax=Cyphellophora europaea (strain CBS 101466) TaxID=1220924 RepID=W2S8T2_CYPE1|nr:uncharacterized protein HMPREF1541_10604 [Cyphellophora europaea CBS 101466]ETN44423.1 hypothetical protein HMPREF1541_10604 [Cyphellophora europaea CBS 101466]
MDKVPTRLRVSRYAAFDGLLALKKRWFWIDSLCIPVAAADDATHAKEAFTQARTTAIDSMNITYAYASLTLVLDAEMLTLSKHMHVPTLMAYASHCGWTTRAWTLQEGSLSRRVVFALSDGILEVDRPETPEYELSVLIASLLHRLAEALFLPPCTETRRLSLSTFEPEFKSQSAGCLNYEDILLLDWSRHKIFVQALGKRDNWEHEMLLIAWNGLIHRHTTYSKDLIVVLANILGYRASDTVWQSATNTYRLSIRCQAQHRLRLSSTSQPHRGYTRSW